VFFFFYTINILFGKMEVELHKNKLEKTTIAK